MAGVSDVIRQLAATCPELETEWRERGVESDKEPLPYAQASALAEVVVEAYLKGETGCFPPLFEAVEELVTNGGREERDVVVVGFLEDLQAAIGWAGLKEATFRDWLGPNSLEEWERLLQLWDEIRRKKATGELPSGAFDAGTPDIESPELRRIFKIIYRPPPS